MVIYTKAIRYLKYIRQVYRVFFEFCLVRKANKNINLNRLFMDDTEFERGDKRLFNEIGFIFLKI